MRSSLVSKSGRAVTTLCAACRREVLAKTPFSTTAIARQTPASKVALTATPRKRWLSHSAPASPSTASTQKSKDTYKLVPRYYALFPEAVPDGPPPDGPFALDTRALRREFLKLQATAHPDFHHSASGTSPDKAAARRQAEAASALINSAFKTLAHPLQRAEYLLHELYGVDLAGDERGAETSADPEVLMTVLEAREAVEEAEREEDLAGVRNANEERIVAAEEALGRAFAEEDVASAKEEAVRLRYWMNIRESVDNWEKGKPVVLQH
ncbi:HSCB C-terminal oligomerization domain-containing protein [Immersiella caudata]|uniref:HSCB C-terminal oligomerization domain-containing protein n=1 Tax=Immersiella caudata TaxID=314043 RepID=A0AA39XEG1_9PEZI|nr:HSCB C-terminal oligomerization domain-containing protein [Immersiella caudata]